MQKKFFLPLGFLAAFILWTLGVCFWDVQAIGPNGSSVGFGAINGFVHNLIGVHFSLYLLTDWLGLIPLLVCLWFGITGLWQWLSRKQLRLVDPDILLLGGFYGVVIAIFLLFEIFPVNFRPILIEGILEASYPSSTTLLTMCVMPSAAIALSRRLTGRWIQVLLYSFTFFMVIGRFLSGVHWFSDIVGGILLSIGLVTLYAVLTKCRKN